MGRRLLGLLVLVDTVVDGVVFVVVVVARISVLQIVVIFYLLWPNMKCTSCSYAIVGTDGSLVDD